MDLKVDIIFSNSTDKNDHKSLLQVSLTNSCKDIR